MTMIACDAMPVAEEEGPDELLEEVDAADDDIL